MLSFKELPWGWEQDGRRMLGQSLLKELLGRPESIPLCSTAHSSHRLELEIRNGTVLLIPEHAARFVFPLTSPLLSLLGKFLGTPGGNAQASVLCQGFLAPPGWPASFTPCLSTACNSFSYRVSSWLWWGLWYQLTFPLGYIGSTQRRDWELGSVLRHGVN